MIASLYMIFHHVRIATHCIRIFKEYCLHAMGIFSLLRRKEMESHPLSGSYCNKRCVDRLRSLQAFVKMGVRIRASILWKSSLDWIQFGIQLLVMSLQGLLGGEEEINHKLLGEKMSAMHLHHVLERRVHRVQGNLTVHNMRRAHLQFSALYLRRWKEITEIPMGDAS